MKHLLLIIVFGFSLISCNSTFDKLQGKWWYEVADKGDDIIKFTKNKVVNINDKGSLDYEINDDSITIEKVAWLITKITDNELVITKDSISRIFRVASKSDFLIGKWKGTKNDKKIKCQFTKKGEVKIKEKGEDETQLNFSINKKMITIDNESFEFEFNNDKTKLTLKGNETFKLDRD
jgi:hypothetical protein